MWTVINPCTSLYIFSTTDKNGEEVNLETLKVLFNIIFWQAGGRRVGVSQTARVHQLTRTRTQSIYWLQSGSSKGHSVVKP